MSLLKIWSDRGHLIEVDVSFQEYVPATWNSPAEGGEPVFEYACIVMSCDGRTCRQEIDEATLDREAPHWVDEACRLDPRECA